MAPRGGAMCTLVNEARGEVSVSRKVEALRRIDAYPVPASSIEVIETHFAWVFLVGDHAYKMKKPAAYPLLDLRSLEDRHRNCLAEVRLNRRLAPEVYLGAVPLTQDPDGVIAVDGKGDVVDWLVWMKRLPAQFMLDRAMVDNNVSTAALVAIGALLAKFYAKQTRFFIPSDDYVGGLLKRTAAEGEALLAPELKLDPAQVRAAVAAVDASLNSVEPELARRAMAGRVRECHGDLRPEHICLEPVCVIDSLEFSRVLRILDPAEELAFLRLECEVAGAPGVAEQVIGAYRQSSGDSFSPRLLECYQGCRALVRAKILAWHVLDPAVASLAPWNEKALAYLELAGRHATLASAS